MNQSDALKVLREVYGQTKRYPSVLWSTYPEREMLHVMPPRRVTYDVLSGASQPESMVAHIKIEWRRVSEGPDCDFGSQSGYVDFGVTDKALRCSWWLSEDGSVAVSRPRPVAESRDFYYHGNDGAWARTVQQKKKDLRAQAKNVDFALACGGLKGYLQKMYETAWEERPPYLPKANFEYSLAAAPMGPYEKARLEAEVEIYKNWSTQFAISPDAWLDIPPKKPSREERYKAQAAPELKKITASLSEPVAAVQQQCQRCRTQWRSGTYGLELSPIQITGVAQFTCPNCS